MRDQSKSARPKLFTMRISDYERMMLRALETHYGRKAAEVVRLLIERDVAALAKLGG